MMPVKCAMSGCSTTSCMVPLKVGSSAAHNTIMTGNTCTSSVAPAATSDWGVYWSTVPKFYAAQLSKAGHCWLNFLAGVRMTWCIDRILAESSVTRYARRISVTSPDISMRAFCDALLSAHYYCHSEWHIVTRLAYRHLAASLDAVRQRSRGSAAHMSTTSSLVDSQEVVISSNCACS